MTMILIQTLEDVENGRTGSQWLDPKDGSVWEDVKDEEEANPVNTKHSR